MVVYFLAVGPKCHSPPKLDVDLVLVAILIFFCPKFGKCWPSCTIALTWIMVYPTNWVFDYWLSHGCVTYVKNTSMSPSVHNSLLLSNWTLKKDFFVFWSCPFPMLMTIPFPSSTSPLDVGGSFIEKKTYTNHSCA
jgi:hypothetical protein